MLNYLINSIPLILALFLWAIHLERRVTRIETDISWIKENLNQCLPPLDKSTG